MRRSAGVYFCSFADAQAVEDLYENVSIKKIGKKTERINCLIIVGKKPTANS